ncbi:hypothetical protein [Maribacter sp. 2-571]|uniref:hypothetical protein n=1 Tax=Maribacter sp. 2-571 TaxID=3417569 RepID=UPI003D342F31
MYVSKFKKVTLLLKSAKTLHQEGIITTREYTTFLDHVEEEYLKVVDRMENEELSDIIHDLVLNLS